MAEQLCFKVCFNIDESDVEYMSSINAEEIKAVLESNFLDGWESTVTVEET